MRMGSMGRWALALALATAGVAAGCADEDTEAPAAPFVDPTLPTTTRAEALLVLGAAEYASSVTVSRTPAFTAEETAPGATTADPYTAEFALKVPLAIGENKLSFVATDEAGNASDATTITITREPKRPAGISITLDRTTVSADDGRLTVVAAVASDDPLMGLDGFVIDLAATPELPGATAITASGTTDARGVATIALAELFLAGPWTVAATWHDDPTVMDARPFTVTGGLPATITLELVATVDGAELRGAAISVPPDTNVTAAMIVQDGRQNIVVTPLDLQTDAPGAIVAGDTLTNLLVAREQRPYQVAASVAAGAGGARLGAAAELTIVPGPATAVSLTASASLVTAGTPVRVTAVSVDAFGNPRDADLLAVTLEPGALAAVGGLITPQTVGVFTIQAALATDGAIVSSAPLEVLPAAPAVLALTLTPSPAVVQPGGTVAYSTAVSDAFGNAITNANVSIVTDAPGAIVGAGELRGFTRAGGYVVIAQVTGTAVSDTEPLTVNEGPASTIDLALGGLTVVTGDALPYVFRVVDGAGNVVPNPAVTITTNAPAGGATIDTNARTIVFTAEGTFTVTADAGLDGNGNPIVDRETVSAFAAPDRTAPTVLVSEPIPGSRYAPGDVITVRVTGDDDQSLGSIRVQLRGAINVDETRLVPTGVRNLTEIFNINVGNNPTLGAVTIVGAVTDTSGNLVVSSRFSIEIDPSITMAIGGPATAITTLVGGANTRINGPRGAAFDAAGLLYLANSADNRIVTYDPATGATAVLSQGLPSAPRDLFFDGTRMFVSLQNRIFLVDLVTGALTAFNSNAGGSQVDPFGLASAGVNTMVVADQSQSDVRQWSTAAAPLAAQISNATFPTNVGGNLNNPWGVALSGVLLFVSDDGNDEIWRRNTATNTNTLLAANPPEVDAPRDMYLSATTNDLYWVNRGGGGGTDGSVYRLVLDGNGNCVGPCTPELVVGGLRDPSGLVLDPAGDLLIMDEGWDAVFRVTGAF